MGKRRIIVGISGASGFQYGMKALTLLREQDIEVHLVVTKGAEITRALDLFDLDVGGLTRWGEQK